MNFYHWHSLYDIARKHREERTLPKEFYKQNIATLLTGTQDPGRLVEGLLGVLEDEWYRCGQPYYNVHPAWVDQLSKGNLDKIPSECFALPHSNPTVNIRFSGPNAGLTLNNPITLDAIGADTNLTTMSKGSFPRSILIKDLPMGEHRELIFFIDFGIDLGDDFHATQKFHIVLKPGVSLEQAFLDCCNAAPEQVALWKVLHNLLRVVAMVGFLSEGNPELIDFDVLSKYRDEYPRADQARREVMISKSKQRGKNGWNVGNDMMFLGEQPTHSQLQNATGRELNYAHIRNGHPHAFRYGPGRTQVKIKWVLPTVVRPDKPFKK